MDSPRETAKARAAYNEYEAMGPERSLRGLTERNQKYSRSVSLLMRWSAQHHWQDRVKKYDEKIAEAKRKKRQAELEKMDEEHALIGRTQLLRSVRLIEQLIEPPIVEPDSVTDKGSRKSKQNRIPMSGVTLSGAVALMKAGYELERLARGAATSRVEGDVSVLVQPKEYVNIDPDEEGSEL